MHFVKNFIAFFLFFAASAKEIATLTFDDGHSSAYEGAFPILEKHRVRATFYVTADLLGKTGYLTSEQVIALKETGHEIGSHSFTHRNLKKMSAKEVERELSQSKRALETLIQAPVDHFAPPFGAFHWPLKSLLKKYYRSSRSTLRGLNEKDRLKPFAILTQMVFLSTPLSEIEGWLNCAVKEGKWLVLIYHRIDESGDSLSVTPSTLEQHILAIKRRGVPIATIGDALDFIDINTPFDLYTQINSKIGYARIDDKKMDFIGFTCLCWNLRGRKIAN